MVIHFYFAFFQKHLRIFRFNCHLCHRDGIRMGFATRKRLYRHLAFAHNVDPASEDNEANRELILNPPPLEVTQITTNGIGLDSGGLGGCTKVKKSKRGRRKGAKNRLKLDPDTGQLVRTLLKRPRKQQNFQNGGDLGEVGGLVNDLKKSSKNNKKVTSNNAVFLQNTTSTPTGAAVIGKSIF